MQEVRKYFRLLYKYRLIIITIPILATICTYFMVRNLPDVYVAKAQISTGIVDETRQNTISGLEILQESRVTQKFSNLVEMIKMKNIIDQLSYQLILHDLTSAKPFRKPSSLVNDLVPAARTHAIEVYRAKHEKKEGLDLFNPDQNGLHAVLESMGYDEGSILSELNVYRSGTSDFITVEFSSESSELSAFAVNTLCTEFIASYNTLFKANLHKSVNFLAGAMKEKQDSLNKKVAELRNYKIKNGLLNLENQSTSLYSLILENETRKLEAEKTVASSRGAIDNIDAKFNPNDRRYIESAMTRINQQLQAQREEAQALEEEYINSGFEERIKIQADSLRSEISANINKLTDEYIVNPMSTKQALIQRKLELEVQYDLARYSLGLIDSRLNQLYERYQKLVPHEAVIQSFDREIEVAAREYQEVVVRYNQAGLEAASAVTLSQAQIAMPGLPQASKKILLVILSFIGTTFFCLLIFFGIYFFDSSVKESSELANSTGAPVLGHLNILSDSVLDLKKMWNDPDTRDRRLFKDMLRSVRFEIERIIGDNKVLLVTSLCRGEGKTVFSLSLTYAFAMTGKKVLLIDGNFKDSGISKTLQTQTYLEDYLTDNNLTILTETRSINVLANRGGDTSLLEICPEHLLNAKMADLKAAFDIIIIETADLKALNVSSEWAVIADKIVSIFEAGRKMSINRVNNIHYLMNLDDKFIGWVLNKVPGRHLAPLIDKTWLKGSKKKK
ncbi:GumC family protein [Hufsiella ginkgonis]|uniref:Lipopolysaccharide biosynthesis protein n=1 Tax=Hufsiella ginkgonis TaxID=2695274 RepID=A0A7K1XYZ2_9SPHI|nr:lipopolysaccharide biosynthesis protein [Hufsiella ginkgonis]MXV16180.1 lipopolysaccharide biosynthesis protein [Hufsiella ginkgonis]